MRNEYRLSVLLLCLVYLSPLAKAEAKYYAQDYFDCVAALVGSDRPVSEVGKQVAVTKDNLIFLLNAETTHFFDQKLIDRQTGTPKLFTQGGYAFYGSGHEVRITRGDYSSTYLRVLRLPARQIYVVKDDITQDRFIPESTEVAFIAEPEQIVQEIPAQLLKEHTSSPTLNKWIIEQLPKGFQNLSKRLDSKLPLSKKTSALLETFDAKAFEIEFACGLLGSAQINAAIAKAKETWESAKEQALAKHRSKP